MSRSKGQPQLPVDDKVRVVLAVLSGELSAAEAGRRHGVSATAVMKWQDRLMEPARPAWATGCRVRPTGRDADRAAAARGDRAAEAGVGRGHGAAAGLEEGRGVHRSGPFADLEALRTAMALPVSRFAPLAGIAELN
jgi:hypothetical protein